MDRALFEKIQKLDFSRYSQKHKEQLWQEINTRSRPFREQELELAATDTAEKFIEKKEEHYNGKREEN